MAGIYAAAVENACLSAMLHYYDASCCCNIDEASEALALPGQLLPDIEFMHSNLEFEHLDSVLCSCRLWQHQHSKGFLPLAVIRVASEQGMATGFFHKCTCLQLKRKLQYQYIFFGKVPSQWHITGSD